MNSEISCKKCHIMCGKILLDFFFFPLVNIYYILLNCKGKKKLQRN